MDDLEELLSTQPEKLQELGGFSSIDAALGRRLRALNPLLTAASFGGLLTVPQLQSNCCRLESLVHQALALGQTKKLPDASSIDKIFSSAGEGIIGRLEDPAEDLFLAQINTAEGNFCVLEGTWEGAGFFLQRFVNILAQMPRLGPYEWLRTCVFGLLKLADAVCMRAGLERSQVGGDYPLKELPPRVAAEIDVARARIMFNSSDLKKLGVHLDDLTPFIYSLNNRPELLGQGICRSALERQPLVVDGRDLWFLLPTATSAAIRHFCISFLGQLGQRKVLVRALALEYRGLFSAMSLLGGPRGLPLDFREAEGCILASATTQVDTGRYLHILAILDVLDGFEVSGIGGQNTDPDAATKALGHYISVARNEAETNPNFVEGLTLFVICGVGRATLHHVEAPRSPDWRLESVSAYDLETLSKIKGFKPLSLWRILDGRDAVATAGVRLRNVNGLLNIVAWSRSLDGHMVPHGSLPDDLLDQNAATFLVIPQNELLKLRHEEAVRCDIHMEQDIQGIWRRVRRIDDSMFDEDERRALYFCDEDRERPGQISLLLTTRRRWWFDIAFLTGGTGEVIYEYWKIAMTWVVRAVPVLEDRFPQIPSGSILIDFLFEPTAFTPSSTIGAVGHADARRCMSVSVAGNSLTISVGADFERAIFNADNVAERALVGAICWGVAKLAGVALSSFEEEVIAWEIVRVPEARQRHAFKARTFRDFVHDDIGDGFVLIDRDDSALLQIGLGWKVRNRTDGPWIEGKEACIDFLNKVTRSIRTELDRSLEDFNRKTLIKYILHNCEAAALDSERWRRTAGAVLALCSDEGAARDTMTAHENELSGVTQTSRLLVELALCSCPIVGGRAAGRLDISRLMAKVGALHAYGGWAGAIRWDVMEPRLKITTLGDIHANVDFMDEIVNPFSRAFNDSRVNHAIKNYAENLEEVEPSETLVRDGDELFHEALADELGAPLHSYRCFVDFLENLGIRDGKPVLEISRSNLVVDYIKDHPSDSGSIEIILAQLILAPRTSWDEIPTGYRHSDIELWRHRRRLSVLRRPLISIDQTDDPILVIAPGLARDAMGYVVRNYYLGAFPDWQLGKKMRSWQGRIADKRGGEFSRRVASALGAAGWETRTEINVTEVLRKSLDRNYGDIDVLAWRRNSGEVFVIECKDVLFRKTLGDMAEQLYQFRGDIVNGKPDYLRRHLDRVDLVREHSVQIAEFIGRNKVDDVRSYLTFKNRVPMEFALQKLNKRVSVNTLEGLLDSIASW